MKMNNVDYRDYFFWIPETKLGIFENPKVAATLMASHFGFEPIHVCRAHWCKRRIVMFRHPFDRLASLYGHIQKQPEFTKRLNQKFRSIGRGDVISADMSASDFLEVVLRAPMLDRHWQPIAEWSRVAFDQPKKPAIFRLDDKDRASVWRELTGTPWPRKKMNASKHPPGKKLFSEQEQDAIRRVYAIDFELGGYE